MTNEGGLRIKRKEKKERVLSGKKVSSFIPRKIKDQRKPQAGLSSERLI